MACQDTLPCSFGYCSALRRFVKHLLMHTASWRTLPRGVPVTLAKIRNREIPCLAGRGKAVLPCVRSGCTLHPCPPCASLPRASDARSRLEFFALHPPPPALALALAPVPVPVCHATRTRTTNHRPPPLSSTSRSIHIAFPRRSTNPPAQAPAYTRLPFFCASSPGADQQSAVKSTTLPTLTPTLHHVFSHSLLTPPLRVPTPTATRHRGAPRSSHRNHATFLEARTT